jgi:hypothetical protein
MGVGCYVRVPACEEPATCGQSRRVRQEGCRGSTGSGLYKGPIPIVNTGRGPARDFGATTHPPDTRNNGSLTWVFYTQTTTNTGNTGSATPRKPPGPLGGRGAAPCAVALWLCSRSGLPQA